jgi:uncharacterized protein (TIGR03435 family)
MRFEFQTLTMPALAEILTAHLDRPVVDRTGLKGACRLVSENRPPPDAFAEGMCAALDKAGLKLVKSKAPVERIVVDRLEKIPTPN